jgi:hypothetical protein
MHACMLLDLDLLLRWHAEFSTLKIRALSFSIGRKHDNIRFGVLIPSTRSSFASYLFNVSTLSPILVFSTSTHLLSPDGQTYVTMRSNLCYLYTHTTQIFLLGVKTPGRPMRNATPTRHQITEVNHASAFMQGCACQGLIGKTFSKSPAKLLGSHLVG